MSTTLFLALLTGCTGLRNVTDGSHLYTGYKLDTDSVQFLSDRSETRSELKNLFNIKPNTKLLWMRPLLSLHHTVREPKKKNNFRYWLKYKLGEPPTLIEDINLQDIGIAIENRLQNRGNFNARADFEMISKRKTAKVNYFISPGKPYTLRSIHYPEGSPGISGDIHKLRPESILKEGQPYDLKNFDSERSRIEKILKDKGYFNFNADYLLFTADTTAGNRQMDTWLNFKPEMPAEASTVFSFNDIYVFDDYSLQDYRPDTMRVGNYFYASETHRFRPQSILNFVFFEKDSIYSRADHYYTLRRLMGVGAFKYASARFVPDESLPGKLNVNVLLTPVRKISLSTEMSASVKSDNYAGPGLNLNFKDHNLFGGAELLSLTFAGYFDVQFGGDSKGQYSYELLLNASLTFPKFAPFKFKEKAQKHLAPKTILTIGGGTYTRVSLYEMYSLNVALGYSWKPRENITHELNPVDIGFTNLAESSAEFDQFLLDNPNVAKSFEEQFIIGTSYSFTNSRIDLRNRKNSIYLSETIDLAGNLASLFARMIHGSPPDPENPYKLLGLTYSQFIKITSELRYFYTPNSRHQIAFRLVAGCGLPYRNSSTIPYSRQYYVGGTNSIRAFLARSVGPGTYNPPDSVSDINVDQTGDIRLESNIEYRFGIVRFFKGALFLDAGNTWLVNEDPQRPGGQFSVNTFYKDIAIGSGFGFRIDLNFIIFRIDLAFPLYKPYLPEGDRWIFDKIEFENSTWRQDNLIWNIAIGYPF
ncbi:MAG TPA: BamA/TamA family outer membrane protein [Bacteroidales bacterium]|nr:BamA/TamA family outer membrane protein [Bacteroidales bacterium]